MNYQIVEFKKIKFQTLKNYSFTSLVIIKYLNKILKYILNFLSKLIPFISFSLLYFKI